MAGGPGGETASALGLLRPRLQALVAAAAFLSLYQAYPTRDYSYDAVGYAIFILRALSGAPSHIWHEYHMLYMPLGVALGWLLQAAGFGIDPLLFMQVVNSLFSAAALFVLYGTVHAETRGAAPALVATALAGCSLAVWRYASDPEVYPVSLFFQLLAVRALLQLVAGPQVRYALLAGLWAGLAVGFHASSVILVPVVLVACAMVARRHAVRRGLGAAAVAGATLLAVAAAPYAYRYAAVEGRGLTRGVVELGRDVLHKRDTTGETWFLRGGYRPLSQASGLARGLVADGRGAGAALLGLLLALGVAAGVRRRDAASLVLGSWALMAIGFFTAYNVGSIKFVAFQLAPLVMLAALGADALAAGRRGRLVLMAGLAAAAFAMGWANLTRAIRPATDPARNRSLVQAAFIREATSPGDMLISYGMGRDIELKVYLPYFARRRHYVLDLALGAGASLDEVLTQLDEAISQTRERGGRVLVLSDVLEDQDLARAFADRHGLDPVALKRYFGVRGVEPYAALTPRFRLYVLR